MTHPTDDELDALVQELMNRPYRRGSESNDEAAMRRQGEREQAAAAITTLRAQLAEAWAKLSQRVDMHECAMAERDDATLYGVEQKARADRAEAALAAQIEAADALGYTCTGCGHLCGDPDKDMKTLQRAGSISCCPERKMVPLSQAITHDPAKVAALVEAASALERNLGINGVNVGSLRVNLFAALAAWKEAPK